MSNFVQIANDSGTINEYLKKGGEVQKNSISREEFEAIKDNITYYENIVDANRADPLLYTEWKERTLYSFPNDDRLYLCLKSIQKEDLVDNKPTESWIKNNVRVFSSREYTDKIYASISDGIINVNTKYEDINSIQIYDDKGEEITQISEAHNGIYKIPTKTSVSRNDNIILFQKTFYSPLSSDNIGVYQFFFSRGTSSLMGETYYYRYSLDGTLGGFQMAGLDPYDDVDGKDRDNEPLAASVGYDLNKSIKEVEQVAKNKAGKTVSNYGEIFNDYYNNETNVPYAHIEGKNNKAVLYSFTVDKLEGYNLYLKDMTPELYKDLQPNMHIYCEAWSEKDKEICKYRCTIESIQKDSGYIKIKKSEDKDDAIKNKVIIPDMKLLIHGGSIGTEKYLYSEDYSSTHAEGNNNKVTIFSHVEGSNNEALGVYSHAEGKLNNATGEYSHAEGYTSKAIGHVAHVEGYLNTASGSISHAEGNGTNAEAPNSHVEGYKTHTHPAANNSHAEGRSTEVYGFGGHAEGWMTKSTGQGAHSEGDTTEANGQGAHVEGKGNVVNGIAVHGEGENNKILYEDKNTPDGAHIEGHDNTIYAYAKGAHVEGKNNQTQGAYSHIEGGNNTNDWAEYAHIEGFNNRNYNEYAHVEGYNNNAQGKAAHVEGGGSIGNRALASFSHVEGANNEATYNAFSAHVEGRENIADAPYVHVEGKNTEAHANNAHAEGYHTKVESGASNGHAEGRYTQVTDIAGHAEGNSTQSQGYAAHAEGEFTQSQGYAAHAEGGGTADKKNMAFGNYSHVEGYQNNASGHYSHAEGTNNIASGKAAHVEGGGGTGNTAAGNFSHVEGANNKADSNAQSSHIEGQENYTNNSYVHIEGQGNTANLNHQHIQGKYADTENNANKNYVHIVGWGTKSAKKNIHTLNRDGAAWYAESVEAPTIYTNQVVLLSSGNKKFALKVKDDGTLYTEEVKE